MAASNSSRSRGFKSEQHWWGHWARGTRDELIQHGITRDGPFPGDPGENKTTCKTVDSLGREISIQRTSKTTFSVCRDLSDEEKALQEQRERREKEIEDAKKLVASWHKSSAAFRESARFSTDISLGMVEAVLLDGERGGYRYNDATARKIKALVGQLRGLVEGGGIEKDLELRKQQIPACISDSALADDASHATENAKSSPQYGGNVVPFRPAQTA